VGDIQVKLKKRKGLVSEPLSAKPQFTPSRKIRDITTTPGKNQNHFDLYKCKQDATYLNVLK
jgi:hypothetical protein